MARFGLLLLLITLVVVNPAAAHPVPRNNYDRTIVVTFTPDKVKGEVDVRVDYRLEVDELTVIGEMMKPFADEVDLAKYRGKPLEYYAEFTRLYAPIYAGNLVAKANGKPVEFSPVSRIARLQDEKDQ